MKPWMWAIAVVAVLAAVAVPFASSPSDEALIQEALDRAVQSSREGKPGGVLEHLSKSMTYNEIPVDNRAEVAKFIREGKPEVTIEDPRPQIAGGEALVVSPVVVGVRYGPVPIETRIPKVTIVLQREVGRKWLVFPAPVWRITRVTAEGWDPSQFGS
jgi:hypothetical protein